MENHTKIFKSWVIYILAIKKMNMKKKPKLSRRKKTIRMYEEFSFTSSSPYHAFCNLVYSTCWPLSPQIDGSLSEPRDCVLLYSHSSCAVQCLAQLQATTTNICGVFHMTMNKSVRTPGLSEFTINWTCVWWAELNENLG